MVVSDTITRFVTLVPGERRGALQYAVVIERLASGVPLFGQESGGLKSDAPHFGQGTERVGSGVRLFRQDTQGLTTGFVPLFDQNTGCVYPFLPVAFFSRRACCLRRRLYVCVGICSLKNTRPGENENLDSLTC